MLNGVGVRVPSPAQEKAFSDAEGFFVACGNRAGFGPRGCVIGGTRHRFLTGWDKSPQPSKIIPTSWATSVAGHTISFFSHQDSRIYRLHLSSVLKYEISSIYGLNLPKLIITVLFRLIYPNNMVYYKDLGCFIYKKL